MELEFAYVGRITQSFGTKPGLFAATGLFSNTMILIAHDERGKKGVVCSGMIVFQHIV